MSKGSISKKEIPTPEKGIRKMRKKKKKKKKKKKVYIYPIFTTLNCILRRCIQKFPGWRLGARTANGTALCH
jgi:hypothetical protein